MSDEQDKLKLSLEPPRLFGRKKKAAAGDAEPAGPRRPARPSRPTPPTAPADDRAEELAEEPAAEPSDATTGEPEVDPEPAPEPAPEPEPTPAPAPTKKAPAKKAPAKKAAVKKAPAKKAPVKNAPVKKAPAATGTPAQEGPATRATAKKAPAEKADVTPSPEPAVAKAPPSVPGPVAPAAEEAPARKAPAPAKKAAPAARTPSPPKKTAPAPRTAPVPSRAVAEPATLQRDPVLDYEREDAEIIAAAKADETPLLERYPAAALTGGIVGVVAVALVWLFLRGCEAVRGTASCGGGPGFILLLVTFAACVLLGTALLRTFAVEEPGTTSFLAAGVVAAVSLTFLVDLLDNWPIAIVIPLLAAASYVGSVKLTDLIEETAD